LTEERFGGKKGILQKSIKNSPPKKGGSGFPLEKKKKKPSG